jgi:hypothetical protein
VTYWQHLPKPFPLKIASRVWSSIKDHDMPTTNLVTRLPADDAARDAALERLLDRVREAHAKSSAHRAWDDPAYREALIAFLTLWGGEELAAQITNEREQRSTEEAA